MSSPPPPSSLSLSPARPHHEVTKIRLGGCKQRRCGTRSPRRDDATNKCQDKRNGVFIYGDLIRLKLDVIYGQTNPRDDSNEDFNPPPPLGTLKTHRGCQRPHAELRGGTAGYLARTALCNVTQPLTTLLECLISRKHRTMRNHCRPHPRRKIRCC